MAPHHHTAMPSRNLAENKGATFSYAVAERLTAGLKLTGPEVKAAKLGHCSLKGSFVTVLTLNGKTEAWLRGAFIGPYRPASQVQRNYDPNRDRKLLLQRTEIDRLIGTVRAKGLTVIPLRVYVESSLVKVEIAIARSRTKADKREVIKEREAKRQIRRVVP
jgi:SsrA-binding protein